jgi:hypothetical protein
MSFKTIAALAVALAGTALSSEHAFAQAAAECGEIQQTLQARKDLIGKANAASNSKKKMTPAEACTLFGKLQANGTAGLKWITANKEWCSKLRPARRPRTAAAAVAFSVAPALRAA